LTSYQQKIVEGNFFGWRAL